MWPFRKKVPTVDDTFEALTRTPFEIMIADYIKEFCHYGNYTLDDIVYRWSYSGNPTENLTRLSCPEFLAKHNWTWFDTVNECRRRVTLPLHEDKELFTKNGSRK